MRYPLVLALLGLMAVPLASATGGNLTQDSLRAAADSASCRADFESGYIGALVSSVPSASVLSTYADKLNADEHTLNGLAAAGNASDFRDFINGTFDPDMRSANEAITSWRKDGGGKNLSNSTRAALKEDYTQLRATEESCDFNALKEYANDRVEAYNDDLSRYEAAADKLGQRGVSTTDLTSLIGDARSQVVDPLKDAVSSATNASELRQALGQYCLYNGCKDGTNFHMAAHFDSDKLGDVLTYIAPMAQSAGLGGNLTAAQGDLGSVQSELSSIGTSEYAQGQSDQVWGGIRSVAKDVKDIVEGIRNKLP